MDFVQWLRDQLDAEAEVARACAGNGEWDADDIAIYGPDLAPEVRAHMAAHDPARVLREIDAKRRIVRAYEDAVITFGNTELGTDPHDIMTGSVNSLRYTLQLLALPYADRPGFKEEWRP